MNRKTTHQIILEINEAYHKRDWETIRDKCYEIEKLIKEECEQDIKEAKKLNLELQDLWRTQERTKTLEEVEKIIKNIMSNTNEDKIVSSWLELKERIEKMKGEKRMSIKNNKLVCPNCGQEFISEDAYEEVRKTIKEIEKIIIKPPQRAKILTGNNEEILGFILKKDWEKIKGEKG